MWCKVAVRSVPLRVTQYCSSVSLGYVWCAPSCRVTEIESWTHPSQILQVIIKFQDCTSHPISGLIVLFLGMITLVQSPEQKKSTPALSTQDFLLLSSVQFIQHLKDCHPKIFAVLGFWNITSHLTIIRNWFWFPKVCIVLKHLQFIMQGGRFQSKTLTGCVMIS